MKNIINKFKKLDKKKKILLGVGLFFIIALVVICIVISKDKTEEGNTPKPEDKVPEVKKLQVIDLDSNSRPVAVMINNIGVAREYQTGLQDAYMVYEMIVEGGITRMMAVYKDADTAKIGTIRSARHYYLDYALENDAIYVHWGYSEYAQSDISRLGINNVNGLVYGNKYFWKDKSLHVATEHTAYSSMDLINKGIKKLNYRTTTDQKPLLHYDVEEIDLSVMEGAVPANQVSIKYSNSAKTDYEYDATNKNYKRSVNGTPHKDYDTKEQYTAKNIITYQVQNNTISGDVKGRQNLENIGKGEGYYISDGYAVPITWEKSSRSAKTIYRYKNGEEIKVNDGNTYIQIQPVNQTLTIS